MATTTTNTAPTYDQLAWTSLGAAAASITFSSITGTYTDLRLVLMINGKTSASVALYVQFNGDTTGNYSYRSLAGNGTLASSASGQNATQITPAFTFNSTTLPQMVVMDILQYANTGAFKTALLSVATDMNGTNGTTELDVGLWRSTAAITSITLTLSSGNFNTGTTAALYGIKAA